jgi:protein-S-isoprenylcysteine O-methyltransferase Ste14
MSTKKHANHPHLTGEHRWGDTGQLIFFVLFLGVWISDSFVFHYSTFLQESVPNYIRLALGGPVILAAWFLARGGMKAVFGTAREKPEVITTGVFRIVRHPIYTGALLFYLGSILFTLSLASAALWILIIAFYIVLCKYEERLLTEEFGDDYLKYKKRTGMLFPKFRSHAG